MAARAASRLYENKPLKKPRLGAPDVYPQENRQREDELTAVNVKQGFLGTPTIADEYGSAKNANLTSMKFGAFFSALLAKKQEICTLQDNSKRKPPFNPKDCQWLVTPRNKPQVDLWFYDLASNKSLSSLSRKIPFYNKKEDIIHQLCHFQVPMYRAAFYIKAYAAVSAATSDSGPKNKKRQATDPSQEWSQAIWRFLQDLQKKLTESGPVPSGVNYHNQWVYVKDLARHLFDENLLDHYDFLSWLVESFEKVKVEDQQFRYIASLLLQYSENFPKFEILSRKLAFYCCRRLNTLLGDFVGPDASLEDKNALSDLMSCPQHRSIILIMSSVVQIITMKCKTALVWNPSFDSKIPQSLVGSPLDYLPCPPSQLPMARNLDEEEVKKELIEAEEEIRLRSIAVENKWTSEHWHQSGGSPTTKLLSTLDLLDKHCFDRIDSHSSLDILYSKIFSSINSDDLDASYVKQVVSSDEPKIHLLCEWAVTHKRSGEHRSMVVAKLLEKRQNELTQEKDLDNDDDNELYSNCYLFQQILINFLDSEAPVFDERNPRYETRMSFSNLVLLFSELIRCEVFSHDSYMCTLISRGYFTDFGPVPVPSAASVKGSLDKNSSEPSLPMFDTGGQGHSLSWDKDVDDAGVDADLDKLLQNIKQNQNDNHDYDVLLPDKIIPTKDEDNQGQLAANDSTKLGAHRHLLYTTHFPIPQDETTSHECNQRLILLYGVGKARDEARHNVKKVTKEILKLFARKASYDISEGGKVKKSAAKDGFAFDSALSRFQNLSFFDQHCVTSSCAAACIEMLNGVATGVASYLPLVESIAVLFDLMDMALNVHGMINFIIQVLRELPDVELQLHQKGIVFLAGSYTLSIGLYIVGVLFRYQPCLLVSQDDTIAVFDGCLKLVRNVVNPANCSSAERCILGYVFDLYSSCSLLQAKYPDGMTGFLAEVKKVIYPNPSISPSNLTHIPNTCYMMDNITNPLSKVDPNHYRNLNENAISRYSFICNAVKAIAASKDPNFINDLSILCAEMSARCPQLSADWIGLLRALCCSSNHTCGFMDALSGRELSDTSIHDNLAIFTSILVARRCFSLQDLVIHCALPSLLAACPQGGGDQEAEPGARLTCHLLLCLFRTSEPPLSSATVTSTPATTLYSLTSPGPSNLTPNPYRSTYLIKHPCDRYLLAAAHTCMRVEAVIAVLKAILVLGDANTDPNRQEVNVNDLLGNIGEEFGDFMGLPLRKQENMENAGIGEFAKLTLKQICSQDWVHEKCLRDREMLCKPDLLLDTMLSEKQAQQLLDMICHPKGSGPTCSPDYDQKVYITHILKNLDEWTLRISWLQLQLVYAQRQNSAVAGEVHLWLDNVAKATVDFFQSCSEDVYRSRQPQPPPSSKSSRSHQKQAPSLVSLEAREARVWLVAPLVSKLPPALQGKVLKAAAAVLENGNWMVPPPTSGSYSSSKSKDRSSQPKANNSASLLLSYPPFLALVLMCLRGQDDQRQELLKSLYTQLESATCERPTDDIKTRLVIHDGLQLRLSLVGGMLDMILKTQAFLHEWGILLVNLISRGVVDAQLNYELFTTILDMLAVLLHSTYTTDIDESKKQYQNFLKKLRKELPHDRPYTNSFAIKTLRQLVPSSKYLKTIVTCEPMGSLIDTKGNKIAGFDSIDKKQGLQVADKVSINPWDLLEGQKNPTPLCWSWFGAVRYERKPLKSEELVNSLQWHSHSMRKPGSYFLEPPPCPPEETEPVTPVPAAQTQPPQAMMPDVKPMMMSMPMPTPCPPQQMMNIPPSHMNPPFGQMLPDDIHVMKREANTPSDTMSPRAGPGPKKGAPKQPRKRKNAKQNQSPVQAPDNQGPVLNRGPHGMFDNFGGQPPQPGPPPGNWNNYQNQQMPQQNQQLYGQPFPGQPQPNQQPQVRFENRPPQARPALNQMLNQRARNHTQVAQTHGNQAGPPQQMFQQRGPGVPRQRGQQQQQQMPQQPTHMMNQGMFQPNNQMQGPMQGQPMQGQPMQGQPMQGQPMQGQPMQGQPMQQQFNHPSNMSYNQQMQQGPMDHAPHPMMNQQFVQQQQSNRQVRPQLMQQQQQQFMQRGQYSQGPNVQMAGPGNPGQYGQPQQQHQIPHQMSGPQNPQQMRPNPMLQRQLAGKPTNPNNYQGGKHF